MNTPARAAAARTGEPLDEAVTLTKRLKLPYLRKALTDVIPTAKAQRWDPAEVVRVLLAEEAAGRDATNLRTRRKRAAFPTGKTFGDWDETASSIPRATQDALKTLEWLHRRENLSVCGPSGTGKSHLCEALGHTAVEAGMTVAWHTIEDLGVLVRRHRADDSLTKAMTRLIRADLIIVDDIGLLPLSTDAAEGRINHKPGTLKAAGPMSGAPTRAHAKREVTHVRRPVALLRELAGRMTDIEHEWLWAAWGDAILPGCRATRCRRASTPEPGPCNLDAYSSPGTSGFSTVRKPGACRPGAPNPCFTGSWRNSIAPPIPGPMTSP